MGRFSWPAWRGAPAKTRSPEMPSPAICRPTKRATFWRTGRASLAANRRLADQLRSEPIGPVARTCGRRVGAPRTTRDVNGGTNDQNTVAREEREIAAPHLVEDL